MKIHRLHQLHRHKTPSRQHPLFGVPGVLRLIYTNFGQQTLKGFGTLLDMLCGSSLAEFRLMSISYCVLGLMDLHCCSDQASASCPRQHITSKRNFEQGTQKYLPPPREPEKISSEGNPGSNRTVDMDMLEKLANHI